MTPDELRELADRLGPEGKALAARLRDAADAWEADKDIRKRLEAAEKFIERAFNAHPNLDLDIAALAGEESPDATKNATRTDKSPEGYSIDS